MKDQAPTSRITDRKTNVVSDIYELKFPDVIRTGSMGSAKPLVKTSKRTEIVDWGDSCYNPAFYFSSTGSFDYIEPAQYYPLELFTLIAYENNSGGVARDVYLYAKIFADRNSEAEWRLMAIILRGVPDNTVEVDFAYFNGKNAALELGGRTGKVHTRLPLHLVKELLQKQAHISWNPNDTVELFAW